jgi:hypothetical protein
MEEQNEIRQGAGEAQRTGLEEVKLSLLRPHPALEELGLSLPLHSICALPTVTRSGIILEGIATILAAQRVGQERITCVVHEMSELDALSWIIRNHRPSKGFNDFVRIRLALRWEPIFQRKAQANQIRAGRHKGSSNLTEAERIDVRSEIAELAGVGVGNVTKVKQLLPLACRDLLDALSSNEIRIHRAWLWRKKIHEEQRVLLATYLADKSLRKTVAKLLARKLLDNSCKVDPIRLVSKLLDFAESNLATFHVTVLKMDGIHVLVTEELVRTLERQAHLPTCQAGANSDKS